MYSCKKEDMDEIITVFFFNIYDSENSGILGRPVYGM